jgi:hypothetical protein
MGRNRYHYTFLFLQFLARDTRVRFAILLGFEPILARCKERENSLKLKLRLRKFNKQKVWVEGRCSRALLQDLAPMPCSDALLQSIPKIYPTFRMVFMS